MGKRSYALLAQLLGAEEDGEVLLDGEAGEDAARLGDEEQTRRVRVGTTRRR